MQTGFFTVMSLGLATVSARPRSCTMTVKKGIASLVHLQSVHEGPQYNPHCSAIKSNWQQEGVRTMYLQFGKIILERCLLLAHKRLTIQTTNAIKDVANEGHISPRCYGGSLHKSSKNAIPLRVMEIIYTILWLVSSHTPSPPIVWQDIQLWCFLNVPNNRPKACSSNPHLGSLWSRRATHCPNCVQVSPKTHQKSTGEFLQYIGSQCTHPRACTWSILDRTLFLKSHHPGNGLVHFQMVPNRPIGSLKGKKASLQSG